MRNKERSGGDPRRLAWWIGGLGTLGAIALGATLDPWKISPRAGEGLTQEGLITTSRIDPNRDAPSESSASQTPPDASTPRDLPKTISKSPQNLEYGDLLERWLEAETLKRSEAEIESLILERTTLTSDDLDGIRDLRRFVVDLARIAQSDVSGQGLDVPETPKTVEFGRYVHQGSVPKRAIEVAGPNDGRLFATFPIDELTSRHAVVSWTHESDPVAMVVRRIEIDPSDSRAHVWVRPSENGAWREGRYRVGVFNDLEPRSLVSYGEFEIRP
jgi:hypothetical protein